jgi:hypothetical protein
MRNNDWDFTLIRPQLSNSLGSRGFVGACASSSQVCDIISQTVSFAQFALMVRATFKRERREMHSDQTRSANHEALENANDPSKNREAFAHAELTAVPQ